MASVLNYLFAVVALGLLIALHELGHLLAARAVGIRVAAFSIGFGPRLLGFRWGETDYQLSVLPLGGYTRVVGMDPGDPEILHPDSYAVRPVWQRLWVVAAGPLMNELLAVFLVYAVAVAGMPDTSSTVLGAIVPDSVAARSGLEVGDRLVALDSQPLERFADLVLAVHAHPGERVALQVARPGARETLTLEAALGNPPLLGVEPQLRRFGPLDAIPAAIGWTLRTTAETVNGLLAAFSHPGLLQGPLAAVRTTAHEAERGAQSVLFTLALISLGLAVFNALPLPALDGGRALFLAYEAVTRKRVSPKLESTIHAIGLLLLLGAIGLLSVLEIGGR